MDGKGKERKHGKERTRGQMRGRAPLEHCRVVTRLPGEGQDIARSGPRNTTVNSYGALLAAFVKTNAISRVPPTTRHHSHLKLARINGYGARCGGSVGVWARRAFSRRGAGEIRGWGA